MRILLVVQASPPWRMGLKTRGRTACSYAQERMLVARSVLLVLRVFKVPDSFNTERVSEAGLMSSPLSNVVVYETSGCINPIYGTGGFHHDALSRKMN